MKLENLSPVNDITEFLANADLLVQESMEWYCQLADSMELHNNPVAAAQFRELEAMEVEQLQWIAQRAEGLTLPKIAPWNFAWDIYRSSSNPGFSEIDYLINQYGALAAALEHEHQAECLYRQVAAQTTNVQVKAISIEMAEQQTEQINVVKKRLEELPADAHELQEDLDPPNMP